MLVLFVPTPPRRKTSAAITNSISSAPGAKKTKAFFAILQVQKRLNDVNNVIIIADLKILLAGAILNVFI